MKDGLCDDCEGFWMTVAHDLIVFHSSYSRVASFIVFFGGAIGNVIDVQLARSCANNLRSSVQFAPLQRVRKLRG